MSPISKLFKEIPKTISIKEFYIIIMCIRHPIYRILFIPLHQQSPPFNSLSKINRPLHRFHTPLLQPHFTLVKQFESCLLIIYALKKTHLSYFVSIQTISFFIDKSSHPSYICSGFICQQPTATFSPLFKTRIFIFIKYIPDIIIQGTHPIGMIFI